MQKSFVLVATLFVVVCVTTPSLYSFQSFAPAISTPATASYPLLPNTSYSSDENIAAIESALRRQYNSDYPIQISIPSIGLLTKVVDVGINDKGEIDVPDGKTKNVGWYRHGTIPGEEGSAVMDAHVYAAFSKLKHVKPGSDIYIQMQSGKKLHFVVYDHETYPLSSIETRDLLRDTEAADLNLITCAGRYIRSKDTYDHRLVVYSRLVGAE